MQYGSGLVIMMPDPAPRHRKPNIELLFVPENLEIHRQKVIWMDLVFSLFYLVLQSMCFSICSCIIYIYIQIDRDRYMMQNEKGPMINLGHIDSLLGFGRFKSYKTQRFLASLVEKGQRLAFHWPLGPVWPGAKEAHPDGLLQAQDHWRPLFEGLAHEFSPKYRMETWKWRCLKRGDFNCLESLANSFQPHKTDLLRIEILLNPILHLHHSPAVDPRSMCPPSTTHSANGFVRSSQCLSSPPW